MVLPRGIVTGDVKGGVVCLWNLLGLGVET